MLSKLCHAKQAEIGMYRQSVLGIILGLFKSALHLKIGDVDKSVC